MTEESDSALRLKRVALNAMMVVWFGLITFWFGPHLILFHKLGRMTPSDFVPTVEEYCVPAVIALKAYQHSHGELPDRIEKLGPEFDINTHHGGPGFGYIQMGHYEYWTKYNHFIEYDFTPGKEGWSVHGAFASGPIPLPPIVSPAPNH